MAKRNGKRTKAQRVLSKHRSSKQNAARRNTSILGSEIRAASVALLLLIASAIVIAGATNKSRSGLSGRSPAPFQGGLNLAKEYVYGPGGRIIATEEPSGGGGCTFMISPTSQNFIAGGGSSSVTVTAGAGCGWTAVSNTGFITINSGANGSGNGTVNYSVAPNTGGQRSGTMTIATQTFTVTQDAAGGCSFSLNPTSQNVIAAGASGLQIAVTTQAGCNWTASTTDSWITITGGASGTGSGTVTYTVAPNTGPQRTGHITAAGQSFTVTQDSGCSFGLSPTSANYTTAGGSGSVTLTANNQTCGWLAVSNNSWITITSGFSGTGNGTVNYTVASNSSSARSGSITIAGISFNITQDGVPVGCQVSTFAGTGVAGYSEGAGGVSKWNAPVGAVVAKAPTSGNPDAVFIADANNNRIRMVLIGTGTSSLIAGDGVAGYSENGNPATARYRNPKGITAITSGGIVTALLIADTDNHAIRKIAWNGSAWVTSLYAGKGGVSGYVDGSSSTSRFNQPSAIVAASSSLIFVADTGNSKIRKLDQNGTSSTQTAAGVGAPSGIAVNGTSNNLIYVSDQTNHKIWQVNTTTTAVTLLGGNGSAGFADGTGSAAQFNSPRHLVWTTGDVLYIADPNNFRVRKLVVSTLAVTTFAGTGTQGNADGACTTTATFKGPQGITGLGPSGELYVVDTADNKIRKIAP